MRRMILVGENTYEVDLTLVAPKLSPREKLNRFGKARPDNAPAAAPPVRPGRHRARRPSVINLDELAIKSRVHFARVAEEERARDMELAMNRDIPGLTPSMVPVKDVSK